MYFFFIIIRLTNLICAVLPFVAKKHLRCCQRYPDAVVLTVWTTDADVHALGETARDEGDTLTECLLQKVELSTFSRRDVSSEGAFGDVAKGDVLSWYRRRCIPDFDQAIVLSGKQG
jgi:hypothetical protein